MRAENLNALIYKSGQAGVTKATVTLIWDNTDAGQSPHGYESHAQITVTRQIVLGGRSKYMINGTTAQLQRVMNLYHSVQLNVNNPHFLIMQGRIAKVINMKPVEVLGMIEEAAGTRMFQNKKENAQKTIQKKEVKVAEIDRVISQDIKPKLEKHKSERVQFVECASRRVSDTAPHTRSHPSQLTTPPLPPLSRYANKTAEVEEHTRFMQAHQLFCLRAKEAEMEEAVSTEKAAREAAEAAKAAAKAELAACEKEEKEVKAKRAKAQGAGGEFKKLEEAEKKAAEALVKEETAFTEAQKSHKADEARVKALEKAEADSKAAAAKLGADQEKAAAEAAAAAEVEAAAAEVEAKAKASYEAEMGLGSENSDGPKNLQGQLSAASAAVKEHEAAAKAAKMQGDHAAKELKGAEKALADARKKGGKGEAELEKLAKEVRTGTRLGHGASHTRPTPPPHHHPTPPSPGGGPPRQGRRRRDVRRGGSRQGGGGPREGVGEGGGGGRGAHQRPRVVRFQVR